jgi:hypothetical protein
MLLRMKLAAIAVAGSAVTLVLAGGPAVASTHASTTGPEVIYGQLHGKAALANAPLVPVKFRGVVNTHGVVNLGGPGSAKNHKIPTPVGKYAIRLTSEHSSMSLNKRTCRVRYKETDTYVVRGAKSTGVFAGASGHGTVRLKFALTVSRYTSGKHTGQCNTSNSGHPVHPKTAVVTFLAVSTLTVR